jgi:RNA recognition motif-containing protein
MFKLFIGGISQDTTQVDLKRHFDKFGQISSFVIVQDKATSVSKGYGFINCENQKTYDRILATKTHLIKDRVVEINQAVKKNCEVPEDIKLKSLKKIFVGGLPTGATKEDLFTQFSQYGKLTNAYIIYNPISGESKNFGYVEFENIADAQRAAWLKSHVIKGKKLSVQLFKTREDQKGLTQALEKKQVTGGNTKTQPHNPPSIDQPKTRTGSLCLELINDSSRPEPKKPEAVKRPRRLKEFYSSVRRNAAAHLLVADIDSNYRFNN